MQGPPSIAHITVDQVTPVVEPEALSKVDHVEEAISETQEAHNPREVVSEVPETHPQEIAPEPSAAHHPVHGEVSDPINEGTATARAALTLDDDQGKPSRSHFNSFRIPFCVASLIYARLLCRPTASILTRTAHLGEPEEPNSVMPSPRRASAPILATHLEGPEELNLAPSPPPRREPKSILSPSSLVSLVLVSLSWYTGVALFTSVLYK
ncbi:hypothetical protein BOTBODRAFT_178703 [Botryobasidium botryosum FD-172 SS1]|uniref:Uncharacterized protein n=1 Tax=Botryobasidium botryosum (strain FD-172 SS1) TaxID=930990 RepID=A0A067MD53_BOTB1|nr:hypothetical protein BOTBODRAFT_178703 [Botryobasidium botryosum FD-172 SS1]